MECVFREIILKEDIVNQSTYFLSYKSQTRSLSMVGFLYAIYIYHSVVPSLLFYFKNLYSLFIRLLWRGARRIVATTSELIYEVENRLECISHFHVVKLKKLIDNTGDSQNFSALLHHAHHLR